MKKVYQAGNRAPVSTYKAALRQHAKFKMGWDVSVLSQPMRCSPKYGVNKWGFKQLIKHGEWLPWKGMKELGDF